MRFPKSLRRSFLSFIAIAFAVTANGQSVEYQQDGVTLKIKTIDIEVRAEKPFSILHVSDSHLALTDKTTMRFVKWLKKTEAVESNPLWTLPRQLQDTIFANSGAIHRCSWLQGQRLHREYQVKFIKDI